MRLRVVEPYKIVIDEEVEKITAEGMEGSFTVLPRHVDMVSILIPGILKYSGNNGEVFTAVNRGIFLKEGDEVRISTMNCVKGESLDSLYEIVDEEFTSVDEREKEFKTMLTRLENKIMKGMFDLEKEKP